MHEPSDIRLAGPEDLAAVSALITAAYTKWLARMDRPPAPMSSDHRAALFDGRVWVYGAPPIGLIVLEDLPDIVLIDNVAVDPTRQGQGIGRKLMAFAEAHAERRGARRIGLYTNEAMTENIAIYEHLGYREVRRSVDGGYRRIHMEKLLKARPQRQRS